MVVEPSQVEPAREEQSSVLEQELPNLESVPLDFECCESENGKEFPTSSARGESRFAADSLGPFSGFCFFQANHPIAQLAVPWNR